MKTIYILGQEDDLHVHMVSKELRSRNCFVRILNNYFYQDHYISYDVENWSIGSILNPDSSVVWIRSKVCFTPDDPKKIEFKDESKERFWFRQWLTVYDSLGLNREGIKVVNPYISESYLKPLQLSNAKACGFTIPQTLITNNADKVIEAFEGKKVLIKPMGSLPYEKNNFIFAQLLSLETISDAKDQLALSPAIFQEYVEKDYEIRTFMFGDQCFSIKVNSQDHDNAKVDWRVNTQDSTMFAPYELPFPEIALLKSYLEASKLNYGAFDLIRTPDGELVFLECNPEGQWLFMEEFTGTEIAKPFAKFIAEF